MSVNATFVADFSKFDTAVKNATVLLKDVQSGAAQVEQSLERMANQFTGVKVIQQAKLMAEAIERVGGVSTLTAAELTRAGRAAEEAAAKMRAQGETVTPEIKKLTDAYAKLRAEQEHATTSEGGGGFFGDLKGQIIGTAAGFVSAQAAMSAVSTAVREVTGFLKDSVKAFEEAEAADTRMVAALRSQGEATPRVIEQYRALATTVQNTTRYSDELTQEMEALLIQVGDIMPDQMDKALKASTDLAAGLGVDLRTATELVAKAAAGHVETLGRYGIAIDKAAVDARGFDAVLEKLNEKFGGQAQAQLETAAGKVDQLANKWNNVQEAVGKYLAKNPLIAAALDEAVRTTGDAEKATDGLGTSFAGLADKIDPALGIIVAYTEALADFENEVAKAKAKMADIKPPPMFQLGDPGHQAGVDKNINSFNQWADAANRISEQTKLAMFSTSALQGRIADLDASVAEGIQYFKDHGAAVGDLAKYYGVTVDQVEAVIEVNKRYKESLQEIKAADAERIRTYQQQSELAAKGTERRAKDLGPEAQIAALRALAAAEQDRARAAFQFIETDEERMKVVEANAKRQLEIQDQIIAKERERVAVVNDAVVRELNARARVAEKQGVTLEGAAMPKELAENPFVVLQKTLADIDAQAQKGISTDKLREDATMKFTETLNEAAKANDAWIASLKPKTGMFAAGESVTPWSTLAPKAIEVKEIGVKYKEPTKAAETNVPVTVNVSGVWDPASVGKIVDVIAPELMRRTGRQLPAA